MMRRVGLIAMFCLLPAIGGSAMAQGADEDCPEGFSCQELSGAVVEIDMRFGAVCFVAEVRTTTVETLEGTDEEVAASCALFVASGDGYALAAEDVPLTDEQAAVAKLGEPLVLRMDP